MFTKMTPLDVKLLISVAFFLGISIGSGLVGVVLLWLL